MPSPLYRYRFLLFAMVLMNSGDAISTNRGPAFAAATSAGGDSARPDRETTNETPGVGLEIPLLPESDPNADIPTLKLGEAMRFEELGPVIINLDGTTRRIDNWNEMTVREREVTWRRISKRNEERRRMLLEKMQQEADGRPPKV